jgi:uncharacterized protein DUF6265
LAAAAHLFKRRAANRRKVRPMDTRKYLVTAASAALLIAAALVQSATLVADDPPARRFDWLSGHWCAEGGGQLLEEFWLPPEGNLALGVGRTVKNGITTSHEFMRIETRDGATHYIAIHDGQPPTPFKLTASGADWARFENPQHDFPKRVEYRRVSSGLHAEIAGPDKNGKEAVIPFEFRRCVD